MDPTDPIDLGNDGLDEFAPEARSPVTPATPATPTDASLMSVVRAEVSQDTGTPRAFSRVESARARRATSSASARGRRALSRIAEESEWAVSSLLAYSQRAASSVGARTHKAISSIGFSAHQSVSSAASRGGRAVSSAANQGRRTISAARARARRGAAASVREVRSSTRAVVSSVRTAVASLALQGGSWSRAAARTVRARRERLAVPRPDVAPIRTNRLRDLESEGSFVAATLALAVLSYGALLVLSWRDDAAPKGVPAVTARDAVEPAAVLAVGSPGTVPGSTFNLERTEAPAVVQASASESMQPARTRLSTASLTALWNRSDTRSLQRAFTNLRGRTLALHRCGMQVTAADRAVARCDGSSSASYTIDFRRMSGRWVIQRVSSR